MSAVEIPQVLLEAIENKKCVLFIGAGLSMGAGLPSWSELILPLAIGIESIKTNDLLKIAQLYVDKYDRPALIDRILEATDTTAVQITDNHRLLAKLPINMWITTNYDTLLEDALREAGRTCRTVINDGAVPFTNTDQVTLIKMHGTWGDPSSIIITEKDYKKFFSKRGIIKNRLADLIAANTFLFLGYSVSDPDFNRIRREVASKLRGLQRRAYAIMYNASEATISDLRRQKINVINIVTKPGDDYNDRLRAVLQKLFPPPPIEKIFLTYDWEDRLEARPLVKALRQKRINVSWDQDWPHWEDFDQKLEAGISSADVVAVYLPNHSKDSRWVKNEIRMAEKAEKRIVALCQGAECRSDPPEAMDIVEIDPHNPSNSADAIVEKLRPIATLLEQPPPGDRSVKELLKAALKANRGIPSDTITDKIFLSPEAQDFTERAYNKAIDSLHLAHPDRLNAVLEYSRLKRFQGEWEKAQLRLKNSRTFARGNADIHDLFCLELGALDFERGDTDGGLTLVREALRDIQKRGVTPDLVKALRQLGNMLREQVDWKEAIEHLTASMHMAKYIKDVDNAGPNALPPVARYMLWSDCVRERASLLMQMGNADEGMEQFQCALDIIEQSEAPQASEHLRGIILYQLGRGYLLSKHDVRTALDYLNESLQILRKYDNPVRLSFLYDAFGRALVAQHPPVKLADAHRYFEKAKRIRERGEHQYFIAYTELGLGNFYRTQGDIEQAVERYETARMKFSELGKIRDLGLTLLALGTAYAKLERIDDAKKCLQHAKVQFKQLGLEEKVRETEFELFKLLPPQPLEELLEMGQAENITLYLNEIGEYRFHDWIKNEARYAIPDIQLLSEDYELQTSFIPSIETNLRKLIRVGIGDDAAVMSVPGSEIFDLVMTTDAAPGSICRSTEIGMGRYAAKFSVVHTLSDILAMGAVPVAILLNLHLLRDTKLEYAMAVVETVMKEARQYGAALIGGDLKERREQSIGCVGIGMVEKGKAIRRSGAREGHIVAITLAGLPDKTGVRKIGCRWAQEIIKYMKLDETEPYQTFCRNNWKDKLLFLPREMITVSRKGLIESAIDTSDGVLACLQLLGCESKVGFILEEELIEQIIDDEVKLIAEKLNFRPSQFLFNAGHDWEIVLTVEEHNFELLRKSFREAGGDLAPLGTVCERRDGLKQGIGLITSKERRRIWIPFFTDEKFVARSYEERPMDWEDLKYYIEGHLALNY